MKPASSPVLVLVLAVMAVAANACTPVGSCESTGCPAQEICEPVTHLCLRNAPPGIRIDLPKAGETIASPSVGVAGQIQDEAAATTVSVSVRVGGGAWAQVPVAENGTFADVVQLPTSNGEPVEIDVRAVDSSGLETERSVIRLVDNVAPTAEIAPANGSLFANAPAVVRFSEPVTLEASAKPIAIDPPAKMTWNPSRTEVQFFPLNPSQSYKITVSANSVYDGVGHKNLVDVVSSFRVAPAAPATHELTGTAGLPLIVDTFDLASDGRGGVSLAVWAQNGSAYDLYLGRINPGDGHFEIVESVTGLPAQNGRVTAGTNLFPPADLVPVHAASFHTGSLWESLARIGEEPQVGWADAELVIPYSDGCSTEQPPKPGAVVANRTGGWDLVRGDVHVALPTGAKLGEVAGRSAEDWELAWQTGTELRRAQYRCTCPTGCEWVVDPTAVATGVKASSQISTAIAENGTRLYFFESATSGPSEVCATGANATLVAASFPEFHWVTPGGSGGRFVGARKTSNGVEVLTRRIEGDCASSFTLVGTAPGSGGALKLRPALFGDRPGVIYLLSGKLFLYVP